jgi:excisionase family DNA binding protein
MSPKPQPDQSALSPSKVARRLSVGVHTVLAWIASGELRALNTARKRTGRPRWKITPTALAEFEQKRSSMPVPRSARRPRRRADYTDYFGRSA